MRGRPVHRRRSRGAVTQKNHSINYPDNFYHQPVINSIIMPKYYREIDYNSHYIQQEAIHHALELDLVHSPITAGYRAIALDQFLDRVPSVKPLLKDWGLIPRRVGFSILDQNSLDHIHLDQQAPFGRLEIPVIGCQYSYTAYYNGPITGQQTALDGGRYWICDPNRAQEVERFTLVKPTFVRVNVPYRTRVTRVHVRRISLCIWPELDAATYIPRV